jgi:hypothetical protein
MKDNMEEIDKLINSANPPKVNKYYLDSNRLHELLMARAKDPTIPVSNELGKMFMQIVEGIMSKSAYRDYTIDWREVMIHNAYMALLKYSHKYDPVRGAEIRQLKNALRTKPLKPVDEGKTAFNYISWSAVTAIFSSITKLKERTAKRIDNSYDDGVLMSIDEVSEDDLNYYNRKMDDNDGIEIDPFEAKREKEKLEAISQFQKAKQIAMENYTASHPNTIRKVNSYAKSNKWDAPKAPKTPKK